MDPKTVLLVEDNPDDAELTVRAFRRNHLANDIVIAKDDVEALDYLFCTGPFSDRDPCHQPALELLDLKLPRIDGLEVLRRVRENDRTALLPVVILTSSTEEDDLAKGYRLGPTAAIRKPVDFVQFVESVRKPGLYWLMLNHSHPQPADR